MAWGGEGSRMSPSPGSALRAQRPPSSPPVPPTSPFWYGLFVYLFPSLHRKSEGWCGNSVSPRQRPGRKNTARVLMTVFLPGLCCGLVSASANTHSFKFALICELRAVLKSVRFHNGHGARAAQSNVWMLQNIVCQNLETRDKRCSSLKIIRVLCGIAVYCGRKCAVFSYGKMKVFTCLALMAYVLMYCHSDADWQMSRENQHVVH